MLALVGQPGLAWRTGPALPVARLVIGRPAEEAAAVLPRIYNLCRGAQETAARLAFGLRLEDGTDDRLHAEILRDHVLMLCVRLPRHFGSSALVLPQGWQSDPSLLRAPLFGTVERLPRHLSELDRAMAAGAGVMLLLRRVRDSFAPFEAATGVLPVPEGSEVLDLTAQENSVAGRWALHPLMREVERDFGRGPFWRLMGRVVELDALLAGVRLPFRVTPDGEAFVPAARGCYGVSARTEAGRVTAFERVTPTDHLLAEGGVLDRSLAALPGRKRGLAPLLLDILDPCVPVRLEETTDA
ncbi:hydrogenase expression/formation protein HupK [Sagittula sp. MA-2]|jgi:hypothetical protein|uniref:hydrogenase expression/formation protein HupK n=1 Tax=Sagittula sp. MA-2 TaxID=3048007 RepID=UPI0024C39599|nr:hydrogenase expression/formation protein HupK [Sagittula sp. MA-2]WHZ34141.1 hydrogenase expression/formation protein HupK [Sagittula sp. MA-2]